MRPSSSPSGPAASQPAVDLRALRGATVSGDAERILATLADHDVTLVLQHAGEALLVGLRVTPERARHPAVEVRRQLRSRHQVGDEELADEIDAVLQGATPPGRAVPVDMDLLIMDMEGIKGAQEGLLNTETGAVCRAS